MLTKGLSDSQWRYSIYDKTYLFGKDLALYLLGNRESVIAEGSVLVLCPYKHAKIMFQVQYPIELMKAYDANFMYMEPGSIIDMIEGKKLESVPYTPKFRWCRMPTVKELDLYNKFSIV